VVLLDACLLEYGMGPGLELKRRMRIKILNSKGLKWANVHLKSRSEQAGMQVITFLMEDEDFGLQVKKNIPCTAELDEKLKTITLPYERMKTSYKYVQENMEWRGFQGLWALDGVKSAWKDKKEQWAKST
jgi:hypothetical protein